MKPELAVELAARRDAIFARMRALFPDQRWAVVVRSAPVYLRNGDVEHTYRQHSDFLYVTGFDEPEAALLLLSEAPQMVLFVREKDRLKETWEGRRAGLEGAKAEFQADEAFPISTFTEKLPDWLEDREVVSYFFGEQEAWDREMMQALSEVRSRRRKRTTAPSTLYDARRVLHESRLIKTPYEQAKMAEVGNLSGAAHAEVMAACSPGMNEWDLQTILETSFRRRGARRLAYDSIVGSGPNATILHYRENNRIMEEGELVLIDAGAELDGYAADITRTFPVGGRFSPLQRQIYLSVLAAQEKAIAKSVPGSTLEEVHEAAVLAIRAGLESWGLISEEDRADEESMKKRINRFFPHRTSHYLGMDVHDVGAYHESGSPRRLQPGMVITVEPGIYFAPDDDSVPEEFRGLGIRIEDDILITEGEPINLTTLAPKTIEDIERACFSKG